MKLHSRLRALLLATILLVGLVPGAVAETADRPTVTIGLALNTNVEDYDTNAFTLYLEEQMNIDVEFFLFEDIKQKLPVLISSGSELPDIICQNLDIASIINWSSQGVFHPLTEYWNNPEMTKNFDARLEELDSSHLKNQILAAITLPDGEIYTLPSYDENMWNMRYYRMWVNQAWLNKLGLKEPTTLDEFTDVLRHFANDDPNGNGIKDEIPLTGSASTWGANPVIWLMNSFLHANPDYTYMNVEDGKVVPAFTQDAYKAALEYIHGLFEEGLIDPLAFTQDQTQMRALINSEEMRVGFVAGGSGSHFQGDMANIYSVVAPVTGPEGVRLTSTSEGGCTPRAFITSYAKDPELCFKILEQQYDYDWRLKFRNGVEGQNWTKDPEVLAKWIGQFEPLGYKPTYVLLDNVWGKPQNVNWGAESFPFLTTQMAIMTGSATKERTPENEAYIDPFVTHYQGYKDCAPAELLGALIHTEAENEILAAIQPAVKSYVEEMAMAFVTGSRGFDQWDSYQNELKAMGLEDYVTVLQAAYDRKAK